jgi:microcystin-dependent protein
MQAANSPPKFPKVWGQNAQGPFIRPIPVDSQIGVNAGFASLNDGFPPLTMTEIAAGGVPPFGQDMNGILKQITQTQQWQQAGGGWQFDANFVQIIGGYPQGAILNSKVVLGRQWVSTVDNNMTDPDSASAANWAPVSGQLPVGTPVPSFSATVPPGYVPANALRLGNMGSGANYASPANLLLFRYIWLNFSNAECPVFNPSGQAVARSANPDIDWSGPNSITLPDLRCAGLIGVDGMGNAATGLLNGVPGVVGNPSTPGSILGENLHTLNTNEMPSHFHSAGISDPSHSHSTNAFAFANNVLTEVQSTFTVWFNPFTATINAALTGVRVASSNGLDTTNSTGGNQSHNTVHRSMTVYWNLAL